MGRRAGQGAWGREQGAWGGWHSEQGVLSLGVLGLRV